MFENYHVFETELAGRKFKVETGKMCGLSNGSCLVSYGDTVVLCNATMSAKPRDGIDFFPLSVDFEEKLYSVGRVPGSFMRREGRPTEKAILTSRVVDRPIRPLFPKDMRNDVSLVMTVMSVDPDCSPEIAGMIGASIAIHVSDIPWNGPIAGVAAGYVDGEIVINPTEEQREKSLLSLTVAGSSEKVIMIEAGAYEVDNDVMLDAIIKSHDEIKKMIKFIEGIRAEIGKEKLPFESKEVPHDMFEAVKDLVIEKVRVAMDTDDKTVRDAALLPIYNEVHAAFDEKYPDEVSVLDECMYKLQKFVVRRWLLDDGKRVDGRGINEIRPLAAEVGLLPRTHGSGMFKRGETQALTLTTLGTPSAGQTIELMDQEIKKRYIHHYNMPPYSVGETGRIGSPSRREIGHGALAERALIPVLPSEEEFPYAMRLVSECVSSNGSTSMASTCGSTLSLMDAGVPIKKPVAGIAMGLMVKNEDEGIKEGEYVVLTDIQGLEDHIGDMDFKVTGTVDGITAIQMDIKVKGVTTKVLTQALEQAKKARLYIIERILEVIPEPRKSVSQFAPKIQVLNIKKAQIGEVIGAGGKVIRQIIEQTGAEIDIDDEGKVIIAAVKLDGLEKAVKWIDSLTRDIELGEVFETATVQRVVDFGAFVEFLPGREGLVHVSKMSTQFVKNPGDIVKEGDTVKVRVDTIDEVGRIGLSMLFGEDINKAAENGRQGFGGGGGGFKPRTGFDRNKRRDFRR